MSHQVRYMVNFQEHFRRYSLGILPVLMQIFALSFLSGMDNSAVPRDETLLFVRFT